MTIFRSQTHGLGTAAAALALFSASITGLNATEAHAAKKHSPHSSAAADAVAEPSPSPFVSPIAPLPAPAAAMNADPYVPQPIDKLMERVRGGEEPSSEDSAAPGKKKKKKKAAAKPKGSKTLEQLARAYEKFDDSKADEALKLAAPLTKNAQYGDYALWLSGRALQTQAIQEWSEEESAAAGKSARASIGHFERLLSGFPYSPHFKYAGRELGRSQIVLGATQCAQEHWGACKSTMQEGLQRLSLSNDLLSIEPEMLEAFGKACSRETDELCRSWIYRLAQAFRRDSAEHKALARSAGGIIDSLPEPSISGKITKNYRSPDADQVSFDLAMALYLEQKYSAAQKSFREFLDTYPRSGYRFRARYWLAQAFILDKKSEEGRKMLESLSKDSPLTYYGLLAALGAERPVESALSATIPQAQARDPYLQPWELYRLGRGEKMIQAGAARLASIELKEIRPREPLSSGFLLYLAAVQDMCGNHSTSFNILGDLISRSYNGVLTSYVIRMIFPTPYMELIEKHARENKLDPLLVLSLIKQESAFDLGANSSTGARGLMQIMPGTFTDVIPGTRHLDMVKMELNLKAGTKYLAKMVNRYNGNWALALAAYNAGPGNADRWLRAAPSKRGMHEFIEAIPFKETREYVASIMRNYFWYSRRVRNESPKLAMFWGSAGASTSASGSLTSGSSAEESTSTTEEVLGPSPSASPTPILMNLQLPMPLASPSPAAAEPVGPAMPASSSEESSPGI